MSITYAHQMSMLASHLCASNEHASQLPMEHQMSMLASHLCASNEHASQPPMEHQISMLAGHLCSYLCITIMHYQVYLASQATYISQRLALRQFSILQRLIVIIFDTYPGNQYDQTIPTLVIDTTLRLVSIRIDISLSDTINQGIIN